jgi:hypothetical protein
MTRILLPAAAAGSEGLLAPSVAGLETLVAVGGLLLRLVSERLLVGDRERRSKREERLTSDSVWSKRDRLELLRSSSAMESSMINRESQPGRNSTILRNPWCQIVYSGREGLLKLKRLDATIPHFVSARQKFALKIQERNSDI